MNTFSPKLYWTLPCLAALGLGALPARAQISVSPANSVTIINTGDGFQPGYHITVSPTGRLSSRLQPRNGSRAIVRTDEMTSLNRRRFFHDLTSAGPLNALPLGAGQTAPVSQPRGRRGRRNQAAAPVVTANLSVPQIYVLYRGQQTPNLRAAGSSAGKAIYQDVKQIMQVLRLPIPNLP